MLGFDKGFEGVETADDATLTITTSTTPLTKVSLTTAIQASERDYVYLAVMLHDDDPQDITSTTHADIRHAGNPMMSVTMQIDRWGNDTNINWAFAEYTTGNQTIVGRYWTGDGSLDAHANYAHILALRYKEPGTSLGSEEIP